MLLILFFIQRQIFAVFEERVQAVVFSDDSILQKYHKVSSEYYKPAGYMVSLSFC